MAMEIERKFKILNDEYKKLAEGVLYRQGYLFITPGKTFRVRICENRGFLTIKGSTTGFSRDEFEYEIPLADAAEMLDKLCEPPILDKHRYKIMFEGFLWEVDEFHGENEGLVIAEIELESENQSFIKPNWIGDEVTGDPRYYNSNLVRKPFKCW